MQTIIAYNRVIFIDEERKLRADLMLEEGCLRSNVVDLARNNVLTCVRNDLKAAFTAVMSWADKRPLAVMPSDRLGLIDTLRRATTMTRVIPAPRRGRITRGPGIFVELPVLKGASDIPWTFARFDEIAKVIDCQLIGLQARFAHAERACGNNAGLFYPVPEYVGENSYLGARPTILQDWHDKLDKWEEEAELLAKRYADEPWMSHQGIILFPDFAPENEMAILKTIVQPIVDRRASQEKNLARIILASKKDMKGSRGFMDVDSLNYQDLTAIKAVHLAYETGWDAIMLKNVWSRIAVACDMTDYVWTARNQGNNLVIGGETPNMVCGKLRLMYDL